MRSKFLAAVTAAAVVTSLAACDSDPTRVTTPFALVSCPTGLLDPNNPINLLFTQRINPATITGSNIVVSNATIGVQFPGVLTLDNTTAQPTVRFAPSTPLPFGTRVFIRVQNLLADTSNVPLSVTVCQATTTPPPITQLFWRALPPATGDTLTGAAPVAVDTGFVISRAIPVFKRTGGDFFIVFNQPYYSAGDDVGFLDRLHGFATHLESRILRGTLSETVNGGQTWDTLQTFPGVALKRLYVKTTGPLPTNIFGVIAGGASQSARFLKLNPVTKTYSTTGLFANTSNALDVDFVSNDTLRGVGVSAGVKINNFLLSVGRVFLTSNGGNSWAEIPGTVANVTSVKYNGVSIRRNGDIYVAGGGGYFLRLVNGAGTYTVQRITPASLGLTNPDSTNPDALTFNDVQFSPASDLLGWVVGAQLVGLQGSSSGSNTGGGSSGSGVPRYQGFIFETRDGGATWIRQGVLGAPNYGGEFPLLKKVVPLNSTTVWAVGAGGTVLDYRPIP